MQKITPCLWFDDQGEEAAAFYTSIFPNSRIGSIAYYGDVGPGKPGAAVTVDFELDGQRFVALNGGPADFSFNEALSLMIHCDSQAEVDSYWDQLGKGGEDGPCGWLKDRYGVSWQVVPTRVEELIADPDRAKSQRVMAAMMKMSKIDIAELERAAAEA